MKAQELRIGNWYKGDDLMGGEHQITPKDIENLFDDPQDDFYQPIPLTEEWLERFGFEKNDLYYVKQVGSKGKIWIHSETYSCELGTRNGYSFAFVDCKNVHSLQNLYFSLTGEELEIVNNK